MPTLPGGATVEQKVVTVINNDTDINASITAEGADQWILGLVVLWSDNSHALLVYTRTVVPT